MAQRPSRLDHPCPPGGLSGRGAAPAGFARSPVLAGGFWRTAMLLCACSYYLGCSIYTGLQKTKNYKGVDLVGATHRFGNFLLGRRVEVHFPEKFPTLRERIFAPVYHEPSLLFSRGCSRVAGPGGVPEPPGGDGKSSWGGPPPLRTAWWAVRSNPRFIYYSCCHSVDRLLNSGMLWSGG